MFSKNYNIKYIQINTFYFLTMILKITDNIDLISTNVSYTPALFSLINKNREYLRQI